VTTARSIDGFKPRETAYLVRDAEVSGLELRVAVDGVKTWSVRYRNRAGEQRRLKLGLYDPARLTLSKARDLAKSELLKIDTGTDPQAARQSEKRAAARAKADSIDALCEAYIERHAKVKKRTWRADRGLLKNKVLKKWKSRAVSSITRRDCHELVQGIAEGAPIVANRVVALLSRIFRFALDEGLVEHSPAVKLPKPGVEAAARPDGERPQKAYSDDEIRQLWAVTESLSHPALRALYRLGLITGQRPGEILGMERDELAGEWWTVPAKRAKNKREHRVYLTPLAIEALATVPMIVGEAKVFAGWRGKRQLAAINAIVFAKVAPRKKPRHAMRDTVATRLAEAGVPSEHIARVLNHAYGPRVTAGYNAHDYDREKRLAMMKWERRLRAVLAAESTDNVIHLTRKGA
jgi:integrase